MNTINVPIVDIDTWTRVFGPAPLSGCTGQFSIAGSGTHCFHDTTPADYLIGHRFIGTPTIFVLASGESLWVKSHCINTVIITEDN